MLVWYRDNSGRLTRIEPSIPHNNMAGQEEEGQMHFQLYVLDEASVPPGPFMQDYLNPT